MGEPAGERQIHVTFEGIEVGQTYDQNELAELWGYASRHPLGRAVMTPAGTNLVILFVVGERQSSHEQHENEFDGETLVMEGQAGHRTDERLADSPGRDEVHLFFKPTHRDRFTYHGTVVLVGHEINRDRPSKFVFRLDREQPRTVS